MILLSLPCLKKSFIYYLHVCGGERLHTHRSQRTAESLDCLLPLCGFQLSNIGHLAASTSPYLLCLLSRGALCIRPPQLHKLSFCFPCWKENRQKPQIKTTLWNMLMTVSAVLFTWIIKKYLNSQSINKLECRRNYTNIIKLRFQDSGPE